MNACEESFDIPQNCYYPCPGFEACYQPSMQQRPKQTGKRRSDTLQTSCDCLPPFEACTIYRSSYIPNIGDFRPKAPPPIECKGLLYSDCECENKNAKTRRSNRSVQQLSYLPPNCDPIPLPPEYCCAPPITNCNFGCMPFACMPPISCMEPPIQQVQYCNYASPCCNSNYG